jgi:hypothetical protein
MMIFYIFTFLINMKIRLTFFLTIVVFQFSFSQANENRIAKNWILKDLKGKEHHLQSILDNQKAVILNFSASWCSISWAFHNDPIIKKIYKEYGPNGSGQLEMFLVEKDPKTKLDCLYGNVHCEGGTMGDWSETSDYPVVHLESNNDQVLDDYKIVYYPSIFIVSPDYQIVELGAATASKEKIESYILHSFKLNAEGKLTMPSCKKNGAIHLDITHGYKNLSFKWSNGANTPHIQNLASGNYSVTITDENKFSRAFNYKLEELPPLKIDSHSVHNLRCHNDFSGEVQLKVSGGRNKYEYKWSNNQKGEKLKGLAAGQYSVIVTDADGCAISESFLVKEPLPLKTKIEALPTDCNEPNGMISVSAEGGWGSYLYRLNNGVSQSSTSFSKLSKGTYKIEVLDQQLCKSIQEIELVEKAPPTIHLSSKGQLSCLTNDSVQFQVTEQSDSILNRYKWLDDLDRVLGLSTHFNAKFPGKYRLLVQDKSTGCIADTIITIKKEDANLKAEIIKEKMGMGYLFSYKGKNINKAYWQIDDQKVYVDSIYLELDSFHKNIVNLYASNNCCEKILADTLYAIESKFQTNNKNLKLDAINELKIYPSPAVKTINLSVSFDSMKSGVLSIENAHGLQLLTQPFSLERIEKVIDVSEWDSGIYYARVKYQDVDLVKMFLVAK